MAEPALAVRFNPQRALELIRARSPDWDSHLSAVEDIEEPLRAVPILRYPTWVEALPDPVRELANDGFDTVIRLPFNDGLRPDPSMDLDGWLGVVRDALGDLSDEMLLLLGTFDRLEVSDRIAGDEHVVEPKWSPLAAVDAGATRELVTVMHNGSPGSRWRLYRRTLADRSDLSGEIAVGLRYAVDDDRLLPAVDGMPSSPFHLFFPTKIGSGLPFLLHGYFEVNAARTGFYDGSAAHNDAVLNELVSLVAVAIADTAAHDAAGMAPLADLLAQGGRPEDIRAQRFHDRALTTLDDVAWVPLEPGPDVPSLTRPSDVLVEERPELVDRIMEAFPPDYIFRRTGRGVPSRQIGAEGHRFLMERRHPDSPDVWSCLAALLRPGPAGAWGRGEEDQRFRALLDLLAALDLHDRQRSNELLSALRGDTESYLLPVAVGDDGRRLLPVPDVAEGVAGRRSTLVMARTRDLGGVVLEPPAAMDVAFLPDGLLDSEAQVDRAKPLGIRDFTVDNVLDRLRGAESSESDPDAVLRFLWALLLRERRSEFSASTSAERAAEFDPFGWFWCRPGHAGRTGPDAERQRRRRLLAATRIPARDGQWRPATTLAFGADWADWLEGEACGELTAAVQERIRAYRALEAVHPHDAAMLAPPDVVLSHLASASDADLAESNRRRHAFLLTLGVWEVLPVEAFESREARNRERFPWTGPLHDVRIKRIDARGGWRFRDYPWTGGGHQKVWIAEDFRFRWRLDEAAARDASATAHLLSAGMRLYGRLDRLAAFCPGCTSQSGVWHTKRYQSARQDDYPSTLALELQLEPWVPAVLNDESLDSPQVAATVWWSERPPSGAGLLQSPLRFLPLCDPTIGLPAELRHVAGIAELHSASLDRIVTLLEGLRTAYDANELPVAPSSSSGARQAFSGLHRLAYERLEELAATQHDAIAAAISGVGVLCDLGDSLGYVTPPENARHDDGEFASYRRYFAGRIPFLVLPRDRRTVAGRLGVPKFAVVEERRPTGQSRDVTDDLADLLADRVPELLAIVAHHSLGAQTLEPGSQQFEERAKRLRNLRVLQVDDLVVDVRVEGTSEKATIGEGSDQDLFLEGATTANPILFHDLVGDGWKETLRRKLAPHLAKMLENPAYSATFALFLLAETDAEREEALHELGITGEDVDAIRAGIGAVSDEERIRQRRWYEAIVAVVGGAPMGEDVDLDDPADALTAAGLPAELAQRLVERGGGDSARSDTEPSGPLSLLAEADVDLRALDQQLQSADPSDGLRVDVAQRRLSNWIRVNRRRVAALLSTRRPMDESKSLPDSWRAPVGLRFALDPAPAEWLGPVIDSLRASGFEPRPDALAHSAGAELIRMGALADEQELESLALQLYDQHERERILRASASAWRGELALLAVLARTSQGEGRSAIRAQSSSVEEMLPMAPASPAALVPALNGLFAMHTSLATALAELITDSLSGTPERRALLNLARKHGVAVDHLNAVQKALQGPRRELSRRLRAQISQLEAKSLRASTPSGLKPPEEHKRPPAPGPKKVAAVKVGPTTDARKRQLGDEGERWALAAILSDFVPLPGPQRRTAIEAIVGLLDMFEGPPVEKARSHAEPACEPELDDEELIDELTELLHVSRHSDGFGFDLLAWLPPTPDADPMALCVEVKSTHDGTFHLSRNEWERAEWFHEQGEGQRYAVLVVHRSAGGEPPKRLDLLPDPVHLVNTGQLAKKDDGYELGYRVS